MNASTLTFNNVELKTINHNNQIWMTAVELARALGYAEADSVTRIYNRNKDEFTSSMTTVLLDGQIDRPVDFSGIQRKIRYFSLRGCHLISMFAKTVIAKQFRIWVLDILDKEVGKPIIDPINNPTPKTDAADAYFSKHGYRQHITEPMRLHLKHHVSTMIRESNLTPQGIFKKFCIHFGIKSGGYEFLPIEKYPAACDYFGIKPIFEPEHQLTNEFDDLKNFHEIVRIPQGYELISTKERHELQKAARLDEPEKKVMAALSKAKSNVARECFAEFIGFMGENGLEEFLDILSHATPIKPKNS